MISIFTYFYSANHNLVLRQLIARDKEALNMKKNYSHIQGEALSPQKTVLGSLAKQSNASVTNKSVTERGADILDKVPDTIEEVPFR